MEKSRGVLADRKLFRKLKGKDLDSCVVPARLREEVGTKACMVGKIVKSRMKWAGHMIRMKDDKLPKRSET